MWTRHLTLWRCQPWVASQFEKASRPRSRLDQLRRAGKPHHADAQPTVHAADERLLKKFENHAHMVALYAAWYKFCRIHKSLRVSPAMAAGVANRLWSMKDVAEMVEAGSPKPGKRGPYNRRAEGA